MSAESPYSITTDPKFNPLEIIDIDSIQRTITEKWFNQTLCAVNDSVIRLGVVQGEFHWHKHDREDEFFYVVSGELTIDLPDHSILLAPQQGFMVPKGVLHRTRASERTVILMIESKGVVPTGD